MAGGLDSTLFRVLRGTADASIRFKDLRTLLHGLGFLERIRRSHHIFSRTGADEIPILKHRLAGHGQD